MPAWVFSGRSSTIKNTYFIIYLVNFPVSAPDLAKKLELFSPYSWYQDGINAENKSHCIIVLCMIVYVTIMLTFNLLNVLHLKCHKSESAPYIDALMLMQHFHVAVAGCEVIAFSYWNLNAGLLLWLEYFHIVVLVLLENDVNTSSIAAWWIDKWCVDKNSGSMKGKKEIHVCNEAEWGLTRSTGFSFCLYHLKCQRQQQHKAVFVFLFSHVWFNACRWISYLCLCVSGRLGLFPGIITYYQPLPISPDAVSEMTAQRESCRMTQTHTARQQARPTQGKLGPCDGGGRRAAWGQVKWSLRRWVSSGG